MREKEAASTLQSVMPPTSPTAVHGSLPQMTPFLPKSPEAGKLGQPLPFYDGETEAQRGQGWTGSGGLPGCDSHIFSEDLLPSEGWGLGDLEELPPSSEPVSL